MSKPCGWSYFQLLKSSCVSARIWRTFKTNNREKNPSTPFQEPVTKRFMGPPLLSNYLASNSNCLEEIGKTGRPGRTKPVKTDLHRTLSQLLAAFILMQKCEASQLSACIVPFPKLASSADPSSSSMGVNTYCYMTQMRLAMELTRIGGGSTLAVSRGSSQTGTIWSWCDGQIGLDFCCCFSKHSSICRGIWFLDTGRDKYRCYITKLSASRLDYCSIVLQGSSILGVGELTSYTVILIGRQQEIAQELRSEQKFMKPEQLLQDGCFQRAQLTSGRS